MVIIMDQVQTVLSSLTMSTREIAVLLDKQHGHLKISAERLAERGVIGTLAAREFEHNGNKYFEYLLNKRDSMILVAQNCPEFTAKIIDRWQELEAQAAGKEKFYIPATLSEALQLAADQARIIEEQRPKVEVYEKLAERKGDVSTTILAKQLGVSAIKLNQWLRDKGMKWKNADLPMAGYMDWFNIIADVKNGHEFSQCLITPLGQIEIAKRFTKP